MSLYGSMFSGVSGLTAQGTAIAALSDNISNINTVGYKANKTSFSTLVTTANSSTAYASGGVSAKAKPKVDEQGLIQGTGIVTDIAISGSGFFAVNSKADGSGDYQYTRAGSFEEDNRGNLVNKAGFTLLAWPLDNNNRLPGDPGNLNTTSSALLESLEPVNTKSISGTASSTTDVSLGLNLEYGQTIKEGAGQNVKFPSTSNSNYKIAADNVIVPDTTGPNFLQQGDSISLTPSQPGSTYTFTYGGIVQSADITTTIFGATTPTQLFTGATAGDNFTITNATAGTVTFTYTPNSPTSSKGEFNTLSTLADAINDVEGLSARVQGNNLWVAPIDGAEALTFADVTGTFAAVGGLNLAPNNTSAQIDRFTTLEGLNNLIASAEGLSGKIASATDSSELKFYSTDPLGTLTVTATPTGVPSTTTTILNQFGISAGTFGPAYDPTGTSGPNIASGDVQNHYSRNIRVFDAFGAGHDLQVSFLKIGLNTWSVEIFALDPSEIVSSRTDGQLANGTVVFNGDGSLKSLSPDLTSAIEIVWANGSLTGNISFDFGTAGEVAGTPGATTIGKTDGLRQYDSPYNIDFVNQNGVSPGQLTGIQIDKDGIVVANFNNGSTRNIYKLALAVFPNPNGLISKAGNVYSESQDSGNFNLKEAGAGGAGVIAPAALEQSKVELSDELTRMIIAQRGYQASSKVIKTVNEMLEELNRVF